MWDDSRRGSRQMKWCVSQTKVILYQKIIAYFYQPGFWGTVLMLFLLSVLQQPLLQPSVQTGGVQLCRPQPAGRAPHREQPCELYSGRSFSWPLQPADAVSWKSLVQDTKVSYKSDFMQAIWSENHSWDGCQNLGILSEQQQQTHLKGLLWKNSSTIYGNLWALEVLVARLF